MLLPALARVSTAGAACLTRAAGAATHGSPSWWGSAFSSAAVPQSVQDPNHHQQHAEEQAHPQSALRVSLLNAVAVLDPKSAIAAGLNSSTADKLIERALPQLTAFMLANKGRPWPSAHQRALASHLGVQLSEHDTREEAATKLSHKLPPSVSTLYQLFFLLGYDGPAPPTQHAAAMQLAASSPFAQAPSVTCSLPRTQLLDLDLSPLPWHVMRALADQGLLEHMERPPFSELSAELAAECRSVINFNDPHVVPLITTAMAHARPAGGKRAASPAQVEAIAALEQRCGVQPSASATPAAALSQSQAAARILSLLEQHPLAQPPDGRAQQQLRGVAYAGCLPATAGEAACLLAELSDSAPPPRPASAAALAAMGYPAAAPRPRSEAQARVLARVLRTCEALAATPPDAFLLGWAEVLASPGLKRRLGPCPSALEQAATTAIVPPAERNLALLASLGWRGVLPPSDALARMLADHLRMDRPGAPAHTRWPALPPGHGGLGDAGCGTDAAAADALMSKLALRFYRGAVSEWWLMAMPGGDAAHLLACVRAAREAAVARARYGGAGFAGCFDARQATEGALDLLVAQYEQRGAGGAEAL